ncbi:hypothetical protein FOA24_38045 [Bacillus thuringiensis]|uniref:hypothetical protein n=1 Tax=Bacillus thuringiensis TaxID=1428 RepID=UPI00333BF936
MKLVKLKKDTKRWLSSYEKYVKQAARKAGVKVALKTTVVGGVLEDSIIFANGAFNGYRKGLKEYDKKQKKKNKKSRR